MIVTVPTDALRDGLKACAAAVSGRPTIPLLAGVLLTVEAQDQDPMAEASQPLVLRTFDHETDIIARVNARVDDASEPVALPSHRLLTVIAASAGGKTITLTTEGARLVVTSGRAEWKLPLMHHNDFPPRLDVPEPTGDMSGQALRAAVEQVAVASGDTPEQCQWISVERRSGANVGTLEMAATDRYRLHTAVVPVKWAQLPDVEVRVSARKLSAVVKPLDHDVVGIGWTGNLLSLHTDRVTVTTALAADGGTWIPWRTQFERITGDPMVFDAADLIDALKQAALVVEEDAAQVTVNVDGTECLIHATEGGGGDSAIPVDVKYDGPGTHLTVNSRFLTDAIDAAAPEGGEVQITQKSSGQPLGIGLAGQPATHIVMPMRTPRNPGQ
jgi:DNA polymerase III subunit beta